MTNSVLLHELKTILAEDFGASLSDSEVDALANKLVGLFSLLIKLSARGEVQ